MMRRNISHLLSKALFVITTILQANLVLPIHSTITLTTSNGTTLDTFSNADLDLPSPSFYTARGTLALATFYPSDNCTLRPIPPDTTVLLVPFDDGFALDYPPAIYARPPLNGCQFYDQIVKNAGWLTPQRGNTTRPVVAVFQSARTGDALGLNEMGVNNLTMLASSTITITLVHTADFEALVAMLKQTAVVTVTSGMSKAL